MPQGERSLGAQPTVASHSNSQQGTTVTQADCPDPAAGRKVGELVGEAQKVAPGEEEGIGGRTRIRRRRGKERIARHIDLAVRVPGVTVGLLYPTAATAAGDAQADPIHRIEERDPLGHVPDTTAPLASPRPAGSSVAGRQRNLGDHRTQGIDQPKTLRIALRLGTVPQLSDDERVSDPEGAADAVATERLILRRPSRTDLPNLFALYADPRVWGPDPLSRHDTIEQTGGMLDNWCAAWRRDGLGIWTAYRADNTFVGTGGYFIRYGVAWNLSFRLLPRFWGQGYAQEISAAATTVAGHLRADLPMTAYVLEGNERSRRAVERVGLKLVWRGADAGNPDASAVRLLFSDRQLPKEVVDALTER